MLTAGSCAANYITLMARAFHIARRPYSTSYLSTADSEPSEVQQSLFRNTLHSSTEHEDAAMRRKSM